MQQMQNFLKLATISQLQREFQLLIVSGYTSNIFNEFINFN